MILYLPGTNMNGIVAPDDVKHSLALYLASSRRRFLGNGLSHALRPAGDGAKRSQELKGWTYDLFASDIDEAVKFVRAHTQHGKIFLVGFSRGVTNEYLYTALHSENVQGLIVLDGFFSPREPKEPPADVYGDDIGGAHLTYDKRKTLMEMVIANPDGPAPIAKYKTARENLEHVVYDSAARSAGMAVSPIRRAASRMLSSWRSCSSPTIVTGRRCRVSKIRSRPIASQHWRNRRCR